MKAVAPMAHEICSYLQGIALLLLDGTRAAESESKLELEYVGVDSFVWSRIVVKILSTPIPAQSRRLPPVNKNFGRVVMRLPENTERREENERDSV